MDTTNARAAGLRYIEKDREPFLRKQVEFSVAWAEYACKGEKDMVECVAWLCDAFVNNRVTSSQLSASKIPTKVLRKLEELQELSTSPRMMLQVKNDPVLRSVVIGTLRAMLGAVAVPPSQLHKLASSLFVLSTELAPNES